MQCKLYVFEKTAQSWIERGRGLLRLNDMASTDDGTLQSRLGTHMQNCFGDKKSKPAIKNVLTKTVIYICMWLEYATPPHPTRYGSGGNT